MSLLPDTAHLRTRARRIDGVAGELSSRSSALRASAYLIKWESLSASAFRADMATLCTNLESVAAGLHRAAAALRAHADSVDHVIAVTLSAERTALDAGEQLAVASADAATTTVRTLLGLI